MDFEKIANAIKENENIAVVIHINPDSDCLGSGSSLVLALKQMGKKAHLFVDSSIPKRLSFYADESFFGQTDDAYDVCIAVDVAATYMMGAMKEKVYDKAKIKCCIDHHETNAGYADFNCVDAEASAAGEVIYTFLKDYLKADITDEIAKRLYAAIAADTGSFQYSNTTAKTHLVASELLKKDIDAPNLMRVLFERKSIEQLMLKSEVVQSLKFFEDGRICVAVVDALMLKRYHMAFEEADDLASLPRSVNGVEVGIYAKVKGENEVKMSLRSNEYVDVSSVAASLGGGGHKRAAGVTISAPIEEALDTIIDAVKKVL